jgi:dolichol-phosphate mannosyltransferase
MIGFTLAILIPTFNESLNISTLLPDIKKIAEDHTATQFTIVIIDDSSPDGTAQIAATLNHQLASDNFRILVINRQKKEGLGKAYIDGFERVLAWQQPPQYILQMDADLSHDPKYLRTFIEAAYSGSDLIVGTRYTRGGSCPDWAWHRKLLSLGGNCYARAVLGTRITDYTGGFNMYSTSILQQVMWGDLDRAGYGFLIDLKYQSLQLSSKLTEIPIIFLERQHGISKMPLTTIFQNFLLVLRIKFKSKSTK